MDCKVKVLRILRAEEKPVGASYIKETLKNYGESVSEAKVGRILFTLDSSGYSKKNGYRGRLITKRGREYLELEERKEALKRKSEVFLNTLNLSEIDEVLEALEARKVVEAQIVRYAAKRCNTKAKRDLKVIIDTHEKKLSGQLSYEYNEPFHSYIGSLCGNKILEHMLKLVIDDTRYTPILKRVEKRLGEKTLEEHKIIAQAIVSKDEDQAERSMKLHIDGLVEEVKKMKE